MKTRSALRNLALSATPIAVLTFLLPSGLSPSPSAGAATGTNPCRLMTKQQVQRALHAPITSVKRSGSTCTFTAEGAGGSFVSVAIIHPYSAAQFHSDYLLPSRKAQYTVVKGVGNQAVFRATQSEVDVRKGTTLVSIDVDVLGSNGESERQPLMVVKSLAKTASAKL